MSTVFTDSGFSDEGGGGAAGTQHDLLAGLLDDDHTQYALLAGRALGQVLIGGTGSGEGLDLLSTAHATKGPIRMGGANGIVWDQALLRAAIGGAVNSAWILNITHAASGGALRIIASANTLSAWLRLIGSADSRNIDIRQFDSGAGGNFASTGLAQAGLGTIIHDGGTGLIIGTGTGTSQPLYFTTAGSLRGQLDASGNLVWGTAAIATNATNGFVYVPMCAGTPTGTPTAFTGRGPIVIDSTNHKLYFYDGTWRDAGP